MVELGWALLQHAKVQAKRELKFLEAFNGVIKRWKVLDDKDEDEKDDEKYFFCSRPDISLKFFVRPKCVFSFWDRLVLKVNIIVFLILICYNNI